MIVLAIAALFVLWIIGLFNSLVTLKNRVKEAWSDIDVQLKRRYDLIPNLIESVKGYMSHEKSLLETITQYRSQAMSAKDSGDTEGRGKLEGLLSGAIGKLQVAFEAYPDLKANQNVAQLMDELSDTENKIQSSRRFYNGNVRDFNTKIERFPANLIAGMLKFTAFKFFEVENEVERQNVKVDLSA